MAYDVQNNGLFQYALNLSQELNQCLDEYYEKTQSITQCIREENEDDVFNLNRLIDKRETIISKYNSLLKEYQPLEAVMESQVLNNLKDQRYKLLGLIKELDDSNFKRVNELYNTYKNRIKEINNGKKIINAYNHSGPLSDGFFIDKRK